MCREMECEKIAGLIFILLGIAFAVLFLLACLNFICQDFIIAKRIKRQRMEILTNLEKLNTMTSP